MASSEFPAFWPNTSTTTPANVLTRGPVARGEIHLVRLGQTLGSETGKTRPCLIVSPDELNRNLRTAIVVPMTTGGQTYPWRVPCRFQNQAGFVALGQLRTVDTERLFKRLGRLAPDAVTDVLRGLQEMFTE